MRDLITIGSLLIFFIQSAISQPTQTIRGKVVDQESQIPLVGANIIILEAGPITGVITNQEGLFIIEEIPVGRYNLFFSYVGYESFIIREVVVGTAKEVFLQRATLCRWQVSSIARRCTRLAPPTSFREPSRPTEVFG